MSIFSSSTNKAVGLFVAVMMFFGVVAVPSAHAATLTEAQISAILDLLSSFGADQATIDNVDSALRGEAVEAAPGAGASSVCPYTWTRNLEVGSTGDDVKKLQQFLNDELSSPLASSGPGSPGSETSYYGSITAAGVKSFQAKYSSDILAPLGLTNPTPFFYPSTRDKANSLCTAAPADTTTDTTDTTTDTTDTTTDTTTTVTPQGTGLTVTLHPNQPESGLAPTNATRLPFTILNLTASSDGDVTVNDISVKLDALADDDDISNVMLMNEDGTLIGIPKTLDSNDSADVGTDFVVSAGTTKTVIIGATIASSLSSGTTANFQVTSVNTSATVHGSLPMTGTIHTLNDTLSIGTATNPSRGSLDPGAAQGSLDVNKTGFNASGVKFTAGSNEKLWIKSIRWYQTGSVSPDDLENVRTVIDGTEYPTTRSGDYYTSTFPGDGLEIDKGFSKDMTLRIDIVSGSSRTIDFDIDRREDVHVVGQKFGYGILPAFGSNNSSTDGGSFDDNNNPYYDAFQHTVSAGTMQVSSWTRGVPAENIAENVADQPIAGFTFDVDGEPITVGTFTATFNVSSASANLSDITNAVIVDESGVVLAGPVDGSDTDASEQLSFSDTITFPVGLTRVYVKAKLSADFDDNDSVMASTTVGNWSNVTGDVTGDTITPTPSTAINGPTQTVKAGSLTATVSSQPTARTIIAGANQFELARFILDASQSGEDVRLATMIPVTYNTSGTATDASNCKLYDGITSGATVLTTGSNVVNPSSTGSSTSFTFDGNGLTLPKGTSKTLSLRCDLTADATTGDTYQFGLANNSTTAYTGATGLKSGETIAESTTESAGQQMTAAASGSYTVSNDTSVLYKLAQAGSTGVTLAKLRFEADTTEDITLKQIALELGTVASNSPTDFVGEKIRVYHGGSQVGIAQFNLGDGPDYATSTLDTPVTIVKGELETFTFKADLSSHDANSPSGAYGAFVRLDYDGDNNGINGNYASGVDSGANISGGTTSDVSTNGLRIYRTVPSVEDVTTQTAILSGADLYKVKITAGSGRDVLLSKLSFKVSATGQISAGNNWQLYGPNGAVNANSVATSADSTISGADRLGIEFDDTHTDRLITAGNSKTYALRGTFSALTSANTETLNIALVQDASHSAGNNSTGMGQATDFLVSSSTDRFIWSPNSTTTPEATAAKNNNLDWTNSYGVPGFPSAGQDMSTRSFTD